MKKTSKKLIGYVAAHKIKSGIFIILIIGIGYFAYGKMFPTIEPTKYVLAQAERGDVIVSVSGTGQISSSEEVDVKPKVSGDVVLVGITVGQEVKTGQALFSLDSADIKKSIADAEVSLEESKLQLQKSAVQAPIDYEKKQRSLVDAKNDLEEEYVNTFNTVSDTYLKIPSVMTNLENVLYGTNLSGNTGQWNVNIYKDLFNREADRDVVASFAVVAEKDYKDARALYDSAFSDFKTFTRSSSKTEINSFLQKTFDMADMVARATKNEKNLIDTVIDIAGKENKKLDSYITTAQSNLNSNISTANGVVSSLISQKSSLKKASDSVSDIEHDITILEINNPEGNNPIDLQAQKNSIKKKESDLADLRKELVDYTVYAPFSGIIAKTDIKKNDSVSTGTSLATLITKKKIAEISLNEIDAAKVKIGQKTTLTFDALDGISAVGDVIEIDTIGTVSQGVVTYNVKIGFDSPNDQVKSGMSVSASIITSMKQNVIMVANGAIKTQGDVSYVEVAKNVSTSTIISSQGIELQALPETRVVEMGLSNDSMTEVMSGIEEGEYVVTRTILSTNTQTANQTPSLLSSVGGSRAGSTEAVRIPR